MKKLTFVGILLLCGAVGVARAQSLTEIAKKEKERRDKNEGPVTVIDEQTLEGYESAVDVEEPPSQGDTVSGEDAGVDAPVEDAEPPAASEIAATQAKARAERAACSNRLAQARAELNEQQRLLHQGVTRWGETPTTVGGYTIYHPDGTAEIIGGVPGYAKYEQGRVSCLMATRNRSRYPNEAAKCDEIQSKINSLRAEIGAGCN